MIFPENLVLLPFFFAFKKLFLFFVLFEILVLFHYFFILFHTSIFSTNTFSEMWKSKMRVTSYELRVRIHELRVQIHELED